MVGFGDGTDQSLGQWLWLEFRSVGDGLHDRSVAGSVMVGGWIEVWWWVSVAEIGVWWWVTVMAQIRVWWWVSFTNQSLVMGFVLKLERNGGWTRSVFFFFRLDLGGVVCSDGFGGGFRS